MPRKVHNYRLYYNYAFWTPGAGGVFALLGWLLVGALLGNFLTLALSGIGMEDYGFVLAYALMFMPAMVFAASRGLRNAGFETGFALDNDNFTPYGGWALAALCVVATVCASLMSDVFNLILPPMPQWLEDALGSVTSDGPFWLSLLSVSVLAPFFEEWLCRGMVLRGLLNYRHVDTAPGSEAAGTPRGVRPRWAIVLSAAFFALIHANPWQAAVAFTLGCLFGYVYWRTGSLKLTMLMHCTNNTMALVFTKIPALAEAESFSDVLPPVAYALAFVLCGIVLWLTLRRFRKIELPSPHGGCAIVDLGAPEG